MCDIIAKLMLACMSKLPVTHVFPSVTSTTTLSVLWECTQLHPFERLVRERETMHEYVYDDVIVC